MPGRVLSPIEEALSLMPVRLGINTLLLFGGKLVRIER
jgi:hypothetical protein